MTNIVDRVAGATKDRDRVLDSVKAIALLLVVLGHSLAWHVTPDGRAVNVLELTPGLTFLTWVFQVLPLFFAAGAVSNELSLHRTDAQTFRRRRARRLLTPVLIYTLFWTALLLPVSWLNPQVVDAGKFLAQLLWFAGVYVLVVTAAPLTRRWVSRPDITLGVWAAAIILIDVTRIVGGPEWITWLNLLLVWGFLHQLGYSLAQLREARPTVLAAAAVICLAAAVGLAMFGPYSSSLVTVGGDPELSNLAPPSFVLVLYGTAQVLLLAALWDRLATLLASDRLWTPIALFGARGMGVYLWHIPLVGLVAAVALATSWSVIPLSPAWWLLHVSVAVVAVPLAWFIAGFAGRGESTLAATSWRLPLPATAVGLVGGFVVLNISVTGFATWLGVGMLGIPAMALANLALLIICWLGTRLR